MILKSKSTANIRTQTDSSYRQYVPQNLDYSERNQILPKNDSQQSGDSQKMIPKNPGIAQKCAQKSWSNPQKSTQNNGAPPYHDICKLPPPGGSATYKTDIQLSFLRFI